MPYQLKYWLEWKAFRSDSKRPNKLRERERKREKERERERETYKFNIDKEND